MNTEYLTKEGLEKLQAELNRLKTDDRPKTIERLEAAKALGDLSENAEYHDAKDHLGWIEGRIREVEQIVKNAVIIKKSEGSDTVELGSTIDVEVRGNKKTYKIVGSSEADPVHGLISNESPIGSAFLGRAKGDSVSVKTPSGTMEYTILDIK